MVIKIYFVFVLIQYVFVMLIQNTQLYIYPMIKLHYTTI